MRRTIGMSAATSAGARPPAEASAGSGAGMRRTLPPEPTLSSSFAPPVLPDPRPIRPPRRRQRRGALPLAGGIAGAVLRPGREPQDGPHAVRRLPVAGRPLLQQVREDPVVRAPGAPLQQLGDLQVQ